MMTRKQEYMGLASLIPRLVKETEADRLTWHNSSSGGERFLTEIAGYRICVEAGGDFQQDTEEATVALFRAVGNEFELVDSCEGQEALFKAVCRQVRKLDDAIAEISRHLSELESQETDDGKHD